LIANGQIVLQPCLFDLGLLPAIDVGQSVSRVGGKAQRAADRAAGGDRNLACVQLEQLTTCARFGARLDENARESIARGWRSHACLGQGPLSPLSVPAQMAQMALWLALNAALSDPVPLGQMVAAQQAVQTAVETLFKDPIERLTNGDQLNPADRKQIESVARHSFATFFGLGSSAIRSGGTAREVTV